MFSTFYRPGISLIDSLPYSLKQNVRAEKVRLRIKATLFKSNTSLQCIINFTFSRLKTKTMINRNTIILLVFSLAALNMAAPPPPDMWAHTGAPGEVTCVSCHNTHPLNDAGGFLKINTTPPITGGLYLPGQTYLVDETFTRPPLISYQCSTEIIDSTGHNTGTMSITDSASTYLQTAQSGRICLWAGYYGDTLIHCRFSWTAPLSGEVSFYAAGVANDGLIGGSRGYVSTDSLVHLKPDNSSALPVLSNDGTIEVYPNPAKNLLRIKTAGDEKVLCYAVLNINAQTVKTGSTINGTISINDLPSGMYWLQCFTTESKMQVVQFVKR